MAGSVDDSQKYHLLLSVTARTEVAPRHPRSRLCSLDFDATGAFLRELKSRRCRWIMTSESTPSYEACNSGEALSALW
jgi:hypothetical protein